MLIFNIHSPIGLHEIDNLSAWILKQKTLSLKDHIPVPVLRLNMSCDFGWIFGCFDKKVSQTEAETVPVLSNFSTELPYSSVSLMKLKFLTWWVLKCFQICLLQGGSDPRNPHYTSKLFFQRNRRPLPLSKKGNSLFGKGSNALEAYQQGISGIGGVHYAQGDPPDVLG
jgi:hypothetical protein